MIAYINEHYHKTAKNRSPDTGHEAIRAWKKARPAAKPRLEIEQDTTDPRLSTVADMARVMDQELMLIPRQLVPHIASLLRGEDARERRWQPDEEVEA